MNRKNGGFTLIELLVAITVLSIMAGVLLQSFVLSRRMDSRARTLELIQDAAKKTMEEMKGYSFEELEKEYQKDEDDGIGTGLDGADYGTHTVKIAGTEYQYEKTPEEQWKLTCTYERKKDGKTDYLIQVVADKSRYTQAVESDKKSVYSVNQFQVPNIADVSSFQNVVLPPDLLVKDDELMTEELLLMANSDEEDGEEEAGAEGKAEAGGAEEQAGGNEDQDETGADAYSEASIHKYVYMEIGEQSGGDRLTAEARLRYTIGGGDTVSGENAAAEYVLEKEILSAERTVTEDPKTGKPMNRIYLFLPTEPRFKKVFISGDTEKTYELYVLDANAAGSGENGSGTAGSGTKLIGADASGGSAIFSKANIILDGVPSKIYSGSSFEFYTNLDSEQPVSLYQAEDRLYHITVTVYEAEYRDGRDAPILGAEVLKLDSTKSEN